VKGERSEGGSLINQSANQLFNQSTLQPINSSTTINLAQVRGKERKTIDNGTPKFNTLDTEEY
jgi:hypothetical protein